MLYEVITSGDHVDRKCPEDGEKDKGAVFPLVGRLPLIMAVEDIGRYQAVEQQITIEYQDVPGQDRRGKVEDAYPGDQMPVV